MAPRVLVVSGKGAVMPLQNRELEDRRYDLVRRSATLPGRPSIGKTSSLYSKILKAFIRTESLNPDKAPAMPRLDRPRVNLERRVTLTQGCPDLPPQRRPRPMIMESLGAGCLALPFYWRGVAIPTPSH